MDRRNFLQVGAATAALFAGHRLLSADPLGLPIGCQTYPVRSEIRTDFSGTVKKLRAAGITNIELCSPFSYADFADLKRYKPRELRDLLGEWGLTCISAHWAPEDLYQNGEERIAYAKEFGMTQMAVAALGPFDHKGTETVDDVKRYVEPFNRFAEKAHAAGITALLHNEGFVSAYIDGKPVYDMMIAELNPETTKLQFQVGAKLEGYDPVTYFRKYPGRFLSMHCQDWVSDPSKPSGYRQVPLGQGLVNWKEVFAVAKVGGIQNYFIELPQDPGAMARSVPYLQSLHV